MAWPSFVNRPRRSWQLFGIPIHIETSWLFIVAFLAWSLARDYLPSTTPGLAPWTYGVMGVVSAVLLYVCVLLHELGHSLVARGHGIPVACVTLFLFGGVAQVTREARSPSIELKVALAGPLVSLLIAGGCFVASTKLPVHSTLEVALVAVVRYLAMINTGLLLFNLLPGFPLDGGRIVRSILWAWTGSLPKATRIASAMGSLLGMGLVALGGWAILQGAWFTGIWYILLGLFLGNAARVSFRYARQAGA